MKLLLTFILLCLGCFIASAQFTYKIKADSLLVTNDSCTAELNLENSTMHVKGFLFNKGKGRTEFRKALEYVEPGVYLVGLDTLQLGVIPNRAVKDKQDNDFRRCWCFPPNLRNLVN